MTYKKKVKNRIIVSLAAFVLLMLAVLPFAYMTASAAGTTPTQVTSSNYSSLGLTSPYVGYYAIENADQLLWFADYVNNTSNSANGVLLNDIDLTGLTTWKIMETYHGTFDGRGYSIIGMNKDAGLADNFRPGFTAYLYGTVKNLTFDGASVFDQREIGVGVIAHRNYGTISGCMVVNAGVQLGNYAGMGFIAGWNYSGGIIENCGAANSWMMRRYDGQGTQSMGGITQINDGTVRNCYTYNCSFSRGTETTGAIIASGNAPTNSYYYTGSTVATTYGTPKTAAEFNNGTVASLLGSAYGQDIDTWNIPDEYPIVGGPTLYSMYYCHNSSLFAGYSNTNGAKAHQTYSNAGFCTNTSCGAYQPGTRVTSSNYSSLGLTADHEGYWALSNAGQLYWFSAVVKGNYNNKTQNTSVKIALSNNITVNSDVLNSSGALNSGPYRDWIPIGNSSTAYKGTFDGNGKTISGLYYNNSSNSRIGLFSYTSNTAVIKNVGIKDSYFNGNEYVGAVVGYSLAPVSNCYNTGSVNGTNRVGGVVGYSNLSTTDCYNTGAVTGGTGSGFGGVVGSSDGSITNCYNTGSVSASGSYVGGVLGVAWQNTVDNCYNHGSVKGGTYVGGVVGYINSSTVTVKNCYNSNTVSGSSIGGVVGYKQSSATVTNCYYLGDSSAPIGGIGGNDVAGSAEARTTAQFNSGEVAYLLQGGNTTQVWGQNIDNGGTSEYYPVFSDATVYTWLDCASVSYLYSNYEHDTAHNYDNGFCTNNDSYEAATDSNGDGVYEIGNAGQLYWFSQHVNTGNTAADAIVTAYINAAIPQCKYLGIGTESYPYRGTFNGDKHTIELALEGDNASDRIALFEYIGGATIHDLHITGDIVAPASSEWNQYAAGVVSHVLSGTNTIERVTCDVIITSEIDGDGTHGGLVALVEGGAALTLNNCGFSGAINGVNTDRCGGLIGWNSSEDLVITNCYQAGIFNLNDYFNDTINRNTRAKIFENVYYLNSIGEVQGIHKSEDAFESGEVAYLLQVDQTEQVWGQNIDNGNTVETLPVLYGATVYAKMYCNNIEIAGYTNTEGVVVHIWDHDAPEFTWIEEHTSLTVTLTCTIVTTHTLSETTDSISMDTTTKPDYIIYTGTVVLDGHTHANTVEVFNEIISVYITWTEFTFVYTVEWNPETLQYEGTGWEPSTENGGEITVRNDGNVNVNVSFEYIETEATVTGEFVDGANVAVTSPVALAVGAETKVKLTLYGEPVETFISGTLGNVTVTVKKTGTSSLP